MRRATIPIAILLAMLAFLGCGEDGAPGDEETAAATARTTTSSLPQRSARDGCEPVAAPGPSPTPDRRRTRRRLDPKRRHVAVLRTNCGTIRILLAVGRAPKTTASFAGLARGGFYDGLTFHRIAKPGGNDYVIQGGDPLGDGNGGPGYDVVEKPSRSTRYVRGVVAMAKTASDPAGTSGSQFFIVTATDAPLPPDYALLGRVVGGDDVVRRIARLRTDPVSEMPLDPVVMRSVRIKRR